jgi:amino acid adenylation domain-containing protein
MTIPDRIPAAIRAAERIATTATPVTDRWEITTEVSPDRLRADLFRLLEAMPVSPEAAPRIGTEPGRAGATTVTLTAHPATWDQPSSRNLTRLLAAVLAGAAPGALAAGCAAAAARYVDRPPHPAEQRYWRRELAGPAPVTVVPGGSGGWRAAPRRRLEAAVSGRAERALWALARDTGHSRHTCAVALTGWYAARWSAARQVLLACELDRRRLASGAHRALGAFTDALLLPVPTAAPYTFGGLVALTAHRLRAGLRHAGALASDAAAAAGEPLAYRPRPADLGVGFRRLRRPWTEPPVHHADQVGGWPLADLQVTFLEGPAGLTLRVEYDDGMATADVQEFACGLDASFAGVTAGGSIRMLSLGRGVPAAATGPAAPPTPPDFLDRIDRQAQQRPTAPALITGDTTTDYVTLVASSRQAAGWLRQEGVRAGDVVALAMPRDGRTVAVMLGLARLGAAYAPLDATAPVPWTARQLTALRPAVLLTRPAPDRPDLRAVAMAAQVRSLSLPEPLPEPLPTPPAGAGPDTAATAVADPQATAYILFTSGSTSQPKGVCVPRGALSAYLDRIIAAFRLGPTDRVLGYARLTFDVSAFDILATLAAGASCHMVGDAERSDPHRLQRLLQQQAVTVAKLPPAMLPHLSPAGLPHLRLLAVGGEPFSDRVVAPWRAPGREVVQTYGPTETTVGVTAHQCHPAGSGQPPLGRPLPGTRIALLDTGLRPVPRGAVAEICVAGDQVATGYHREPARTAECFVPDPAGTGRLYRTGDLGRWNADGELEFVRRIDRQVQVRGVRVELAEVERVLVATGGVAAAAVVPVSEADGAVDRLVAFVVGAVDPQTVHEHAQRNLPAHAVPARVEVIDQLPITGSGKLDRATLARRVTSTTPAGREEPPEALVAEVARTVITPRLGAGARITGIVDAVQALCHAEQVFDVELAAAELLREPTVTGLAALIHRQQRTQADEATATELYELLAAA